MHSIKSKAIYHWTKAEEKIFDEKNIDSAIQEIEYAKRLISEQKTPILKSWIEFDLQMIKGSLLYMESKTEYESGNFEKSKELAEEAITSLENTYNDAQTLDLVEREDNILYSFFKIDSSLWLAKALKFRSRIEEEQNSAPLTSYLEKAKKLFERVIEVTRYEEGTTSTAEAYYHLNSIRAKNWEGRLDTYVLAYEELEKAISSVEESNDFYHKLVKLKERIIDNAVNVSLVEILQDKLRFDNEKEYRNFNIEPSFIQDENIFLFYVN